MFDKNLMKLAGMKGVMVALVVLALLQAGSIAAQAYGLSRAVCALWEGAGIAAAVPDIVLFGVCFALLQLLRFAQETMLDRYSLSQAEFLRDEVVRRSFDEADMLAQRKGFARVAAIANDQIDDVQTYLRIIPPKIIGIAAISVPLLVCEFALDWVSGVILVVMFPVVIFFMQLLGRQARAQSERQYATYTRLTNRFMDTLRGLPVVKAFGATQREAAAVFRNSESVRKATVKTLRTATLSSAVLDLCATFGTAAVAIMLAFRLMDGTIDLFTGLTALILAPEYFTPVRAFASDYHASLDGKNALLAVLEMIEPAQREAGEEKLLEQPGPASWQGEPFEEVSFKDISYTYEADMLGLQGVTLTARFGQKIGVVGKSGAGKSTLANLFAGFKVPTSGRIEIDGNPVDLSGEAWKSMVRYIPQSPYVFRATLEDNVRFYHPQATREDVEAAVRKVGLAPLVAELPDGLDTMVGEGARGLSGGEAHRVALARILLDDQARVLVFDEPTAHLDIETERDLKEPMLAAMEGRLVLFATHRLHWMADMDVVIELADGRIVQEVVA